MNASLANDPQKKQRIIYFKLIYSPVVRESNPSSLSSNALAISYYTDAQCTQVITKYSDPSLQNLSNSTDVKVIPDSKKPKFADLPFLRQLNPVNDQFRYVIYRGTITSSDPRLSGKELFFSAIYFQFLDLSYGKYYQSHPSSTNLHASYRFPILAIQINEKDGKGFWAEGFNGSIFERGSHGIKFGSGGRAEKNTNVDLTKMEWEFVATNEVTRSLDFFSKSGKIIGSVTLQPIPDNVKIESISEILHFPLQSKFDSWNKK
jgi:hypothetical protein